MNSIFWILISPTFFAYIYLITLTLALLTGKNTAKIDMRIKTWPKAMIMIPHFNEDYESLLNTLETIDAQNYNGDLTILLVDDGSTNGIQTKLKHWLNKLHRHSYLSIILEKNTGCKGKALDSGLNHLKKTSACIEDNIDVLIIIDSDTYLTEGAVESLIARLWTDEKCAVACGYVVPSDANKSFNTFLQYYEYIGLLSAYKVAQDLTGSVVIMTGAFVAHRVSAIKHIGGWGKWIVEDMAWAWKALLLGYKTAYVPQAVAFTECPATRRGLFMQRRRWARGRVEAYREVSEGSKFKWLLFTPMFTAYIFRLLTIWYLPLYATAFFCIQNSHL